MMAKFRIYSRGFVNIFKFKQVERTKYSQQEENE